MTTAQLRRERGVSKGRQQDRRVQEQPNCQRTAVEAAPARVEVEPAVRQFDAPPCPRCSNEQTHRYAQRSLGDGRFLKYCKCGQLKDGRVIGGCRWTWTEIFKRPEIVR